MTTRSSTELKADVADAIEEIRLLIPEATVDVEPDDDGGAFVVVDPIELGNAYEPAASWIGFHITFQYPHADVYPHFISRGLRRADGQGLGESFSDSEWQGRQAIQVSRRSNRLNPAVDTAATKLAKVLEWIRSR